MSEPFTVGAHIYQAGKMAAMTQFHVARRLTPIVSALVRSVPSAAMQGDKVDLAKIDPLQMLGPIADILSKMPDEDSEYILNSCLEACQRKMPGDAGWGPVKMKGSPVQYADIDLPAMLQISWKVIQENLGNFFPGTSPASIAQG